MGNLIRGDSREALNHLSTKTRIADTALEVISRCRSTSTSSLVGGGTAGSAILDSSDMVDVRGTGYGSVERWVGEGTYEDARWLGTRSEPVLGCCLLEYLVL